ncbi:hypothetical protein GQ53DRAFT_772500 [Thozetella sp. PMI_491]|nr:hypothetical protein GQ53DRAFT_772500 [Thozetella sp. PMI_491]
MAEDDIAANNATTKRLDWITLALWLCHALSLPPPLGPRVGPYLAAVTSLPLTPRLRAPRPAPPRIQAGRPSHDAASCRAAQHEEGSTAGSHARSEYRPGTLARDVATSGALLARPRSLPPPRSPPSPASFILAAIGSPTTTLPPVAAPLDLSGRPSYIWTHPPFPVSKAPRRTRHPACTTLRVDTLPSKVDFDVSAISESTGLSQGLGSQLTLSKADSELLLADKDDQSDKFGPMATPDTSCTKQAPAKRRKTPIKKS